MRAGISDCAAQDIAVSGIEIRIAGDAVSAEIACYYDIIMRVNINRPDS